MKLIPSSEQCYDGRKYFFDYSGMTDLFSIVNCVLSHKDSFCSIFLPVANLFLPEQSSVDCDRLFDRCYQYGDIKVIAMVHNDNDNKEITDYKKCTVMDCFPQDKTIRINVDYVAVPLSSSNQVKSKFLFLFICLIRGICHLMTVHFNELSGNEHQNKFETPERIGSFTYPNNVKKADCGAALEFVLFGGIPMIYQQVFSQFCVFQILDHDLPAEGDNIIRLPIPHEVIEKAFNDIHAWYRQQKTPSSFLSVFRLCLPPAQYPFPIHALRAMHVERLDPSTAFPAPTASTARNLEAELFSKTKCILKSADMKVYTSVGAEEIWHHHPPLYPGSKV